jgi:hypothetical protein
MDFADPAELAAEVARLTDELEAALIERDKYRAANETMANALEQMDELLRSRKEE